jgi:hypothetical protein
MLKSQVTCSYCSQIIKDPILLPCDDSICREHLNEGNILKQNMIKCKKCNAEIGVKDKQFKSNEAIVKLIESQSYLSSEEKSLKHELEDSIRKFFDYFDEFNQNRTQLESDAFEHFQELRFQIDEHREELKKRIDDIALKMIDETKKCQEKYLQDLKESFSMFDKTKSLEDRLKEIELLFRDPNLLIQTIKEMQQKQEESLKDIQFKLNEMNQVKVFCEETNGFKPNVSSFNQEEGGASLFGSIYLFGFSDTKSFKSQILNGDQQCSELIKLMVLAQMIFIQSAMVIRIR